MNKFLRHLRGVLGIGLTWGFLWAAVAVAVLTIIGIVRPNDIDPGEEPLVLGPRIGLVGLICGLVLGSFLSIAERAKTIFDLSLSRVAMWGILVTAALFLLTGKDLRMLFFIGPLGAVSATTSVAIVRKWERWLRMRPC